MDNPKRYALVYQAGIANVFQVSSFNLKDYGRDARLVMQSDFRSCECFVHGLVEAGALAYVASCNLAGGIFRANWTEGLGDCPFRGNARPPANLPGSPEYVGID